jgi:predicted nucleic acid-binding protein
MLVIDAGPLVAAASTGDRDHARCVDLLADAPPPLVVPALVVAEVAYFLDDRIGHHAERAFAESFRDGELVVEPIAPRDWPRIVELLDDYADLPLGIVDASIVAACERLDVETLATLDRRHFSLVRLQRGSHLNLVPT